MAYTLGPGHSSDDTRHGLGYLSLNMDFLLPDVWTIPPFHLENEGCRRHRRRPTETRKKRKKKLKLIVKI